MGFNGFVVPDFGFAVRDPVAAANAGVDLPALPPAAATSSGLTAADFTSGADLRSPPGRHGPPDPVRDLRLRPVRQPTPGDALDRGLDAPAPTGGDRCRRGRHGPAQERPARAAPVEPRPENRADRADRQRRGVRDRRVGGRAARRRPGDHSARRHLRACRAGRRHRKRRTGLGRRRGLPHAGSVVGAHPEQRNRVRVARAVLEQLHLDRRSGGHRGRPDGRPHEPSERSRPDRGRRSGPAR